ncbi:UNVERIFIED_CONTAM: hypothetical protein HDU68_001838 [Siphonaria sp. JEL0065]|nr:hypothetical protein HDU68_001838 [Siphonaria sp. JEL0065]
MSSTTTTTTTVTTVFDPANPTKATKTTVIRKVTLIKGAAEAAPATDKAAVATEETAVVKAEVEPAAAPAVQIPKKQLLFLCTHNSARSQMAEGLLNGLASSSFFAQSAGTEETHVRPLALKAMAAIDIDISHQYSKTLDQFLNSEFDYVITVCDNANEACPYFKNGKNRLHWSFPDPSKATGTEEEQLVMYATVRDAIRVRIENELLAV